MYSVTASDVVLSVRSMMAERQIELVKNFRNKSFKEMIIRHLISLNLLIRYGPKQNKRTTDPF